MDFRGAVVDLDGTVYRGKELLAGAREGVTALREAGCSVVFLSNNPTKTDADYVARLEGFGLDVEPGAVLSSGTITTDYLADRHADDRVFVVGSSGLREQMRAADLALTTDPLACDLLVGSYDRGFDYDALTDGLWALEAGATFVGTDPDPTVPVHGGRDVPGSGAILGALSAAAGREPDRVMGKPSEEAAAAAEAALGVPPEECLVVGDRLSTDVALGERAGMTTVLVLTGVTARDDLAAASVEPDHVIESLGEIGRVLDAE